MAYSETPIFPAKTLTGQAQIASGSNSTVALVTADASHPAIVRGPIVVFQKGSASRVLHLELKNGSTVTVLGRMTVSGVQYSKYNFLSSDYVAGLDDGNPEIRLNPGEVLQITPQDSNAAAIDVTALNAMSFEYPN